MQQLLPRATTYPVCEARPKAQVFEYALRATTAGEFDLPPVQASCMYDPAVACLGKGGRVRIAKK